MIEIYIRGVSSGKYKDVTITEGSTTIELGLHDEKEARALADAFQEAIDELLKGYSEAT